jgi:hypothetical protein
MKGRAASRGGLTSSFSASASSSLPFPEQNDSLTSSDAAVIPLLKPSDSIRSNSATTALIKRKQQQQQILLHKLSSIDSTIQKLQNQNTKKKYNKIEKDLSYHIETKSIQTTSCPHCYEIIQIKEMRKHLIKDCQEKLVLCPEYGCGVRMPQNEIQNHLLLGCKVTRARRVMTQSSIRRHDEINQLIQEKMMPSASSSLQVSAVVSSSTSRPSSPPTTPSPSPSPSSHQQKSTIVPPPEEIITCPDCHERLPPQHSNLNKHQQLFCSYRKVFCLNRHLGCDVEVPLVHLDHHLTHDCEVEMKKEQFIQRSKKRLELVQCPGCGENFPLGKLSKHEREECLNRKVPCRNAILGCPVMVRLKDRKLHEDVHSSIRPRSCLYFNGSDTHVLFKEDDILPPWTIEFWIYRPSVVETTRGYLREVLRLGNIFRQKIFRESKYRIQLMSTKKELQDITQQSVGNNSTRNNNLFLNSAFTELTLKLAKMIQEYEKIALETILYGQLYYLAIKSAQSEIELGKASRNHREMLDLTAEVDGTPCKQSYHQSTFTAPLRGTSENKQTMNEEKRSDEEEGEKEEGNGDEANDQPPVEEEEVQAEEEAETDAVDEKDAPEGFDELGTRMIDFDWRPKLWKEWGKQMKDLEDRYENDQEIITQWRVLSGLINDPSANKKSTKSNEDQRGDAKRAKQERRERREKKYKMNKSAQGESKFSELAKNVLALHQGSSILCHSDKANICLSLSSAQLPRELIGDQDRINGSIGYCDWLHGLVSFDYTVPRERWSHIAIHATQEPKKRVYFYSDGVLMQTIKEKIFSLPMQTIGSPYLPYHGYILDIRYWAKARSVPEIKLDMKCLLHLEKSDTSAEHDTSSRQTKSITSTSSKGDSASVASSEAQHLPDLSGKSLIGWWTLEDGGHSRRVRDISDHRFPSALRAGRWYEATSLLPLTTRETILANPTLSISVPQITLPLPSYLEKNLCSHEIRRSKLAQRGRALLQYVPCPNSCSQQMVRKIHLRSHLKFECEERLVSCRYEWCGQLFPASSEWNHYQGGSSCVMSQERSVHVNNWMASQQMTRCTLCSQEVMLRELLEHERKSCVYRLVSCPYEDCQMKFAAHQRRHHEVYECVSEQRKYQRWLVERARERSQYARPWGIEMTYGTQSEEEIDDREGEEVGGESEDVERSLGEIDERAPQRTSAHGEEMTLKEMSEED